MWNIYIYIYIYILGIRRCNDMTWSRNAPSCLKHILGCASVLLTVELIPTVTIGNNRCAHSSAGHTGSSLVSVHRGVCVFKLMSWTCSLRAVSTSPPFSIPSHWPTSVLLKTQNNTFARLHTRAM